MLYRITDLRLGLDEGEDCLPKKAAEWIRVPLSSVKNLEIWRKSLDARKGKLSYLYQLNVTLSSSARPMMGDRCRKLNPPTPYYIPTLEKKNSRPVVVGFGPAGIFAALLLAKAGLCPLILERGKPVEERKKDVNRFFVAGELNFESNIQFGEGGAGTFSDGKLNTLLKDKDHRGRFVLSELVKAGAPSEILYQNKPHVGTDRLSEAISSIRKEIIRLGGEIRFEHRLLSVFSERNRLKSLKVSSPQGEYVLPCETLFLGIGHSARDTFSALREAGVPMEKKVFSVGVRIEHSQEKINRSQYKEAASLLPAADYKLAVDTSARRKLYTFCMCPGGVVVPAASFAGGVVTNGMSTFSRDGVNANSALLMNVFPEELSEDLFSGFGFQQSLEEKAFSLGGGEYRAPCQRVEDFLLGRASVSCGSVQPTYSRGVTYSDFAELFSSDFCQALREGIVKMGSVLKGFDDPDALLTGVESRATCPIRILRGENFQSQIQGLYPIGEGAGYAGGIMSSAMDGMRSVEAYFQSLEEQRI